MRRRCSRWRSPAPGDAHGFISADLGTPEALQKSGY